MSSDIQFETPENIRVTYRAAGAGTRFVAWFVDMILVTIVIVVMVIVGLILGASLDITARDLFPDSRGDHMGRAMFYVAGILWAIYSIGSLFYFGMSELLARGQTLGKRWTHIRVVKADGFSLDPLAIFLRTLFRVVDHMPPLWIVPLFTAKTQRLGDLVAGTVVVVDEPAALGGMREQLASRRIADSRFQFDATMLKRARPQDVLAVEKILERWEALSAADRQSLLARLIGPLAARLQVEPPSEADWGIFLEDFLAAEYRRQHRKLG